MITNFRATSLDSQISLSWTNPADPSFVRAMIVRKQGNVAPGSPTDGTSIYEGTGSSFVDTNLSNGIISSYAAFAVTLFGVSPTPSLTLSSLPGGNGTPAVSLPPTSLLAFIAQLRTLVLQLFAATNQGRTLSVGSEGQDVWALQVYLMISGNGPASLKLQKVGPTSRFGPLTQQALQEFQAASHIPATGVAGRLTRGAMKGK